MDFSQVLDVLKAELILKNNIPKFQLYSDRKELIRKIEAIIFNVVDSVASGEAPTLQAVISLTSQNNYYALCRTSNQKSNDKLSSIRFSRNQSRSKFTGIIFLLSKIYALMMTNQIITRRELYYENTEFFQSQDEVDRYVREISCLLDTPPWEIPVSATSKGIVAGPVVFTMANGSTVTCDRQGGVPVPQNVSEINIITSKANWVLIIEKDAAFQKFLDSDGLSRLGPVIFITAKGYPDINTRLLIRKIWDDLHVPILCLVDADPHGIEIMCVYRFGSMAMSSFSEHLACPFVLWLGIHPTDILSLKIDSKKMSRQDFKKIDSLLKRSYIQDNIDLKNQIEILCKGGVKAEIEGVSQISPAYIVDDYLPSKILGREYF